MCRPISHELEDEIVKRLFLLTLCATCLIFTQTQTLHSQDQADSEGCKDSGLVTRMPGATIHSCDNKEYDQFDITVDGKDDVPKKHVEGEMHTWDYGTREGVSQIQVFRNLDTALRSGGFHIVYEDSPGYISANKGKTWIVIDNSGSYYYQTIITEQEMKQEVTADASSLKDELEKSGHVAVYGILFETGKATLQPSSESTLTEIVKLMQDSADLKLRVEGHTDNVGAAAANQALSQRRADTVKSWLVSHDIAADRLVAKGFGDTKPVADNSTDEGKAKNRRVELAKL
jgi:OmpA-OmpF porin, OOP family